LIQVHNRLARQPEGDEMDVRHLEAVAQAFESLRQQGKVRFWGLTGQGSADVLREAVASSRFQTIQSPYNLLNPSAARAVPADFPYQDYGQIITHAAQHNMGVIAIRILAGGALSGTVERHPVAARSVDPIASERSYDADVQNAQRFAFLIHEGIAGSLVEAAIRFVIGTPGVSTALLGISSPEQLEQAVQYVERGPLPAGILHGIGTGRQ
jgi:aryl-alcohol dehydrogenase-like predicted oxidoreductase